MVSTEASPITANYPVLALQVKRKYETHARNKASKRYVTKDSVSLLEVLIQECKEVVNITMFFLFLFRKWRNFHMPREIEPEAVLVRVT
uniref:Uncharacterized protein n=1 Tax=Octopus bimaculoides TaxID=37653 RepID=A0A0L8HHZ8_OCTBM